MKISPVLGVNRVDEMAVSLLAQIEAPVGRVKRSSADVEAALKQNMALGSKLGAVSPVQSLSQTSSVASSTRRQDRRS